MKHINQIKRGGFALTEVLLAIAVIIIIGIAAYKLYVNAKISAEVEQVNNTVTQVLATGDTYRQTFRRQAMQSGMYVDVMKFLGDGGLLPADMKLATQSVAGTGYWIANSGWRIEYVALPDGRINMFVFGGQGYGGNAQAQNECIPMFKVFAKMTSGQLVLNNGVAPYFYNSGDKIDVAKLTAACADNPYNRSYEYLFDSDANVNYH